MTIIIQGPISEYQLQLHEERLADYWVYYSTWKDSPIDESMLHDKVRHRIIKSDYPKDPGPGNINYQRVTTSAPLLDMDEGFLLQIDTVLKLRSDTILLDPKRFFNELENRYSNYNQFGLLSWFAHDIEGVTGYFPDYIMFGQGGDILDIFKYDPIQVFNGPSFSEYYTTKRIFSTIETNRISFFLDSILDMGDIWWQKYDRRFSQFLEYPQSYVTDFTQENLKKQQEKYEYFDTNGR